MGSTEIELKLLLDRIAAQKLRRDPAIHTSKKARARNRKLLAVYFDTEDLALKYGGVSLRVRQEGAVRIQTLKMKIPGSGVGLQRRLELDAPTKGQVPDLTLFDDVTALETVRTLIDGKELLPIFSTDIRRTIWDVFWQTSEIELVLDEGVVRSGKRIQEIIEAELELKSGAVGDILHLARELTKRNRFIVDDETKASRGYRLFLGEGRQPKKSAAAIFGKDDSAWIAFSAMLGAATDQMIGNQSIVLLGEDPEGVHQTRVAVRRARALLTAYRSLLKKSPRAKLAKHLRWLQIVLGPARDWDVFLEETLEPLSEQHRNHRGLKELRKRARKARSNAYEQAREALVSRRYAKLQLRLLKFTLQPHEKAVGKGALAYGADLLDERLAAVLRCGGDDPHALPEETKHALRIEIKKFRYAMEFFQPIHGESAKPMVRASKKLQDCLGALNDAVVARILIDEVSSDGPPLNDDALDLVRADFANRIDAGLDRLVAHWARFRELPRHWRPEMQANAPNL